MAETRRRAAPRRKKEEPTWREATYPAARNVARIMQRMFSDPHGWSFESMQQTLGITRRTLQRYTAVFDEELVDSNGRPLLEVAHHGEKTVLRRADYTAAPTSTAFQLLSLHFAYTVVHFLQDAVIKQGIKDLWERLSKVLPVSELDRLGEFRKKFYSFPYAVKQYKDHSDVIDEIVSALVYQRRVHLEYGPAEGGHTAHEFEPYTLAMYRGGLYLIGKSDRGPKVITLAVERIATAERTDQRFDYPKNYSPEKYTDGTFGIISGPETEVVLDIRSQLTVTYLKSRRLHPTQKFEMRPNGTARLSMTVRGTDELRYWILSFGPWIKVVKPKSLRDQVAAHLREAAALYG